MLDVPDAHRETEVALCYCRPSEAILRLDKISLSILEGVITGSNKQIEDLLQMLSIHLRILQSNGIDYLDGADLDTHVELGHLEHFEHVVEDHINERRSGIIILHAVDDILEQPYSDVDLGPFVVLLERFHDQVVSDLMILDVLGIVVEESSEHQATT